MKCFKQLGALALFFFATGAIAHEGHGGHEGHDHVEETTDAPPSDVHTLKTDNFKDFIAAHPLVLAEFYAPWCGHCKALAPEYETAATKLKEKDIPLVKVDCTEEQNLCQEFGVSGYPTVKVFRGLESNTPYNGARKADAIVSYMVKQSLPAVSILDKDSIKNFKTADKVVLIAYLDADDKEATEAYTKAATTLRDNYLFGSTTDAALTKEEGVKAPAIVLYKTFDEPKTVYDGKFNAEEIEQFAKTASVPLIGEVGPETYAGYMQSGIPLAYLFVADDESKNKLTAELRPIAEKFKGKINFATIDAVAYGAHASNLNLEVGKWPAFAIQETHKNVKYPYDQDAEISEKAIAKFVQDYSDGKIEPSIKSEPIPEKQEGPVHIVVAHNYKDLVIDTDKDVLLEFYAPWCGHCKSLAPIYDELGKLYFDKPEFASKVIVAKVDATTNDVPDEIQGFPTIKLFPAGKKDSPVDYQGSRTVEDLANFIRDNGAHKVDAYVPPPPEPEAKKEKEPKEEKEPKDEKEPTEESKVEPVVEVKDTVKPVADDDDIHEDL